MKDDFSGICRHNQLFFAHAAGSDPAVHRRTPYADPGKPSDHRHNRRVQTIIRQALDTAQILDIVLAATAKLLPLRGHKCPDDVTSSCMASITECLDHGEVLVRGLVPTGTEMFVREGLGLLAMKLEGTWQSLGRNGIDIGQIRSQDMLPPATCFLENPEQGQTVENVFSLINHLPRTLTGRYNVGKTTTDLFDGCLV